MRATSADRIRQVIVTLAEVFCLIGTAIGSGLIGTSVEDTAGGALSAEATLIAPAGPAFSIWSVIYLGLFGYTVWQWWPSVTTNKVARRTGWLAAVSMVLNATWLLVTQVGWIWVSVVVILALAVVLGLLLARITPSRAPGLAELIWVHATFGLYLGWVAVATCANITTALVSSGANPPAAVRQILAVIWVGKPQRAAHPRCVPRLVRHHLRHGVPHRRVRGPDRRSPPRTTTVEAPRSPDVRTVTSPT